MLTWLRDKDPPKLKGLGGGRKLTLQKYSEPQRENKHQPASSSSWISEQIRSEVNQVRTQISEQIKSEVDGKV